VEHKSGNICEMREIEEKLLWIGGGLEELSNWAKEMPPYVRRVGLSEEGDKKPKTNKITHLFMLHKPVLPS